MRLLIVDNETSEREALTVLCQSYDDFSDLETAASGSEALEIMHVNPPDVVLLECQLSDMTGFDVLRALGKDRRPTLIMMAADGRHAAKAFESAAIDYLTRPVAAGQFEVALARVRAVTRRARAMEEVLERGSSTLDGENTQAHSTPVSDYRLVGERAGRFYFLAPSDVVYIEANGNYVTIHSEQDKYINRDSLRRLAPLLEGSGFVRISRSIIVNLRRVKFAERASPGVLRFMLGTGVQLLSGAGFRLGTGAKLDIVKRRRTRRAQCPD
jgi:two-component system LytT family response regulator